MNKIDKQVLENIYNDLLELSDLESQKIYWSRGKHGKASSYIELMNRLFDDDNLDSFIDQEAATMQFDQKFIEEMNVLRNMLNDFNGEKLTHDEILNDLEWQKIAIQAQKVLILWRRYR